MTETSLLSRLKYPAVHQGPSVKDTGKTNSTEVLFRSLICKFQELTLWSHELSLSKLKISSMSRYGTTPRYQFKSIVSPPLPSPSIFLVPHQEPSHLLLFPFSIVKEDRPGLETPLSPAQQSPFLCSIHSSG